MKSFLKKRIRQEDATLLFICALFLVIISVFQVFNLSNQVLNLLLWLLAIVTVIYLVSRAIYAGKQEDLASEIEQLQLENDRVRAKARQQINETEEYFMMWVHQMKTPITASQLLLDQSSYAKVIQLKDNLLEIENYTNMALHYLRLVNPDRDLSISTLQLDDIIRPLIKKYRSQFIHQQIKLHYESLDIAVITEGQLTSLMIEQVLNNALKYTKNGDIWISFDQQKQQLSIKDSGQGIPENDLPKIFDKGYAGFNGQLNQQSSGIGLYLVKTIANRLNQPVSVQSTLGKGTIFTIQFKTSTISTYR